MTSNEWKLPPEMPYAACRADDVDPDWWFADFFGTDRDGLHQQQKMAIKVCRICPHAEECLRWALNRPEHLGIWGGVTAKGRANMRRMGKDEQKQG